jgi:hypothetical protein
VTKKLKILIRKAATRVMSDNEREKQRESFAYGNVKVGNDCVTRDMVHTEAQRIDRL